MTPGPNVQGAELQHQAGKRPPVDETTGPFEALDQHIAGPSVVVLFAKQPCKLLISCLVEGEFLRAAHVAHPLAEKALKLPLPRCLIPFGKESR